MPTTKSCQSPSAPMVGIREVDVVGPVCESGDFFARNRELPAAQEGDLLAILDAGAYGMSLASNYNTRPRAPEVLVDASAQKSFADASPLPISWHLSASSNHHFRSSVFRNRITPIFAIAFGCELAYPRFPLESPMQPNQYDAATSTALCVWCYSQVFEEHQPGAGSADILLEKMRNRGAFLAARQFETRKRINPRARPSGRASSRRVFLGFFISSESLLDFSSKICDHEHGEGCAFCILQRTAHSSRPEIARSRVNSCGW